MVKKSIMCLLGEKKYGAMLRLNEGILAKRRNVRLKNKHFTIISNNCWGAYIYRLFKEPYFLKMVNNLEYYINNCKLIFIKPEESKHYNELKAHDRFGEYPVGKLGDIEIMFRHYKNEAEALEKWTRRTKRINWENIIIKFNDQNGCTEEQIAEFNRIKKFKKMICFTAKKYPGRYNIHMWEFKKDGYVVDDKFFVFQHVNLYKLLEDDD